jgi:hypothetical protein
MTEPRRGTRDERVRHLHDLCRNIWLSLVILLAAILDIRWAGRGVEPLLVSPRSHAICGSSPTPYCVNLTV